MKNISQLILYAVGVVVMFSCGTSKDRIRFEGELKNITHAEFYVYSEDGAFEGVDTIRIDDGEFVYERKLAEPAVLTLLYPNYTKNFIVVEPGKVIKMKGDAAKLAEAEVTGNEENELLTDFRIDNLESAPSTRQLAAAQFIRTHAQTLAAVAVFRRYFATPQNKDVKTAYQLLDVLVKAQPHSRSVQYINNFYRPIFKNGVGQVLPEFTAKDINGKKICSSDYQGKPLVIVCLATWHNESFTFLNEIKRKLKEAKKPWQCIVVSMDVDHSALREQMKTDTIGCPVICDRKAFESPLVQKLGLHYVPSCMLVSEDGTILQRDVVKPSEAKLL